MDRDTDPMKVPSREPLQPRDHVSTRALTLPARAVVRAPGDSSRSVTLRRRLGPYVQVVGSDGDSQWVRLGRLLDELAELEEPVSAEEWRAHAGSEHFLGPLRKRLTALGVADDERERLIGAACADPGPHTLAALDAATRLATRLAERGVVDDGVEAALLVRRLLECELAGRGNIPAPCFSATALPDADGEKRMMVRGVVLAPTERPPRPDPDGLIEPHAARIAAGGLLLAALGIVLQIV